MKYMLMIARPEGGDEEMTPEQMKDGLALWQAFTDELHAAGAFIAGEGLQESATATTVRLTDDGERVVTDGPYAEAKEQVGGFYLIECADLDEALEWAKKIPNTRGGVEVRPVMDYSGEYESPQPQAAEAS